MNCTLKFYKLLINGVLFLAISLGIFSCTQKSKDSKDIALIHNDAKFNDRKEKDARFMVDAAELIMEEIQLGQLAQTQGRSRDVKETGKLMNEAHTKSLDELKKIAAAKSITIPTELDDNGKSDYKKLMIKTGNDFDQTFCQMMVEVHKSAIKIFETASTDAGDIEIKNFANKTLPELRKHLDRSMTCEEKYK